MPHHKSAVKRLRTAEKSRRRNIAIKSVLRRQLKRQRAAEGKDAPALLPETHATLDRAVRKGVIPKARASRLKSRTARKAAS
jgi:small subunit ribosomal protein S20